MVSICFYFHVHQPHRIGHYRIFDVGENKEYFDDKKNKEIIEKITGKCYLPMNNLLLKLINKHKGKFKVSFSITGTFIEQLEEFAPEVLDSFKKLAKTGCVEFVSETYYHSLSFLYSKKEFVKQVKMQEKLLNKHFKVKPKVFRNTELIFNNELAKFIEEMGYEGILCEGADRIMKWKSPDFVYGNVYAKKIKLLTKNYKLSDDIAFRFSNKGWEHHPLSVEKYVKWLNKVNGNGNVINLFMDYETFGEHQWEDTGIFKFMEKLPEELLKNKDNNFVTVSEALKYPKMGDLDMHDYVSWADTERDLTAWIGNKIQDTSLKELYALEKYVYATKNKKIIDDWRKLTTSDHFYYMCTKYFNDGDVHKYFSPYDSPYDAYINFMNVLNDLVLRIKKQIDIKKIGKNEVKLINKESGELIEISEKPSSLI
ncbi:glycoside hydrolase family 57 protein [Candidatus Woesearchaeota archaeon]|nr:glycoside hydrolase family 57 protein [Candidatus Woesearchaeota archaeon]MCF7901131.1 glycoside hydrolase family 57 protein [Candidatus Woesearchaeota archaeon]MCF8012880.1 glycoside hydrolase family 57 protein [Candidatus Woesearchaeota archaeon]